MDEDQIQNKNIEILKKSVDGKQNAGAGGEKAQTQNLSNGEVFIFTLFTFFLFIGVYLQLDIQLCFQTNHAIENWIANATFNDDVRGSVTIDQLRFQEDYIDWLDSFFETRMYETELYPGKNLPEYQRHAVPDGNILISPIRLTQRKIKLIDNKDTFTMHLQPKRWKSVDEKISWYNKPEEKLIIEETSNFTNYNYKIEGTIFKNGGYVVNFDVHNNNLESIRKQIDDIRQKKFIDEQTQLLMTDMMFYNSFNDIYTMLVIETHFTPNGLVNSHYKFMNVKGTYYELDKTSSWIRMIIELLFCIILVVYTFIEGNQIMKIIYRRKLQEAQKKLIYVNKQRIKRERKEKDKRNKKLEEYQEDDEDLEEVEGRIYIAGEKPNEQQEKLIQAKLEAEQRTQELIDLVKLILRSLLEHFQDAWNIFDCLIIGLSLYSSINWMQIIYHHSQVFSSTFDIDIIDDDSKLGKYLEGLLGADQTEHRPSVNLVQASQNDILYLIGTQLMSYRYCQGFSATFVVLKFMNFIQKYITKVGMLFDVIELSKNELIYFTVIFMFSFTCFVIMFKVEFGSNFVQFSGTTSAFQTLWRFLMQERSIVGEIEEYSAIMSIFCINLFIIIMQFIFLNMIRAFISHAYVQVVNSNQKVLTLDEQLKMKHLVVELIDAKDPFIRQFKKIPQVKQLQSWWDARQEKIMRDRGQNKKVLEKYKNKEISSVLNKKKETQKEERENWAKLRLMIKQRAEKESDIINKRQLRAEMDVKIKGMFGGGKKKLEDLYKDAESENGSLEDDLGEARNNMGIGILNPPTPRNMVKRKSQPDRSRSKSILFSSISPRIMKSQSVQPRSKSIHSHDKGSTLNSKRSQEERNVQNIKLLKSGNLDTTQNEFMEVGEEQHHHHDEEDEDHNHSEEEEEFEIEAKEQMKRILKLQQEEKNKYVLERMDWDKNFGEEGGDLMDEMQNSKNPALMSEYEEKNEEKIQIIKCGKTLWSVIIFVNYLVLIIIVIQSQLKSEVKYYLNSEIDNYIKGLQYVTRYDFNPEEMEKKSGKDVYSSVENWHQSLDRHWFNDDSSITNFVSVDSVKSKKDLVNFLKYVIPQIGQNKDISTVLNLNTNEKSDFKGHFMNKRKYFIGDFIRFKFKKAQVNPLYDIFKSQTYSEYKDQLTKEFTNNFVDKQNTTQYELFPKEDADFSKAGVEENGKNKGLNNTWYKDLTAIPQYLKSRDDLFQDQGNQCKSFNGPNSNYNYTCEQQYHHIYLNITTTDEQAQAKIDNQDPDVPVEYRLLSYQKALTRMKDDAFFDDSLVELEIDFVTYEAYYDLHSLTTITMKFDTSGEILSRVQTKSMRLNNFQTTSDYINLILLIVYIILYGNIFLNFVQELKDRHSAYYNWMKFEIDYLSEVEKNQRFQKKPEQIRYFEVMFTGFTAINLVYTIMTIWSLVNYFVFTVSTKQIALNYPIWPDLNADYQSQADLERWDKIKTFMHKFEHLISAFDEYKIIVTLMVILVTLKLFEFFYKSQNIRALVLVLTSAQSDLLNFLIIFGCILIGFMSLVFLTFGPQIREFSSLRNCLINNFQMSLPNFFELKFFGAMNEYSNFMSMVFIIPHSVVFSFIFSNVFLAIMMNSYEKNIASHKFEDSSKGGSEELNLIRSVFYCLIPNDGSDENKKDKKKGSTIISLPEDKLVLGIDQTPPIPLKPAYLETDFDPYDPDTAYNRVHYLQFVNELNLNMQIQDIPYKLWTQQSAAEIYEELKQRTQIRKQAKELMDLKFKHLQSSGSSSKNNFDEFMYCQKRIEYWNYLRRVTQFISFQNKVMDAILKYKENQVDEFALKSKIQRTNTDRLYMKVYDIEKPFNNQLKTNFDLGSLYHCYDQERTLLQDKFDSKAYMYYCEDKGEEIADTKPYKEEDLDIGLKKLRQNKNYDSNNEQSIKISERQTMRKNFFGGIGSDMRNSMKDGFLNGLGPGSQVIPSRFRSISGEGGIANNYADSEAQKNNPGHQRINTEPVLEEPIVEYMGEFGKPIGNDPDEIENHIRQTEESKAQTKTKKFTDNMDSESAIESSEEEESRIEQNQNLPQAIHSKPEPAPLIKKSKPAPPANPVIKKSKPTIKAAPVKNDDDSESLHTEDDDF